tara:strand:+ start:33264 stop:33695 length:432 start_codon:yes stop_codon:yes gene_type:complete
MPHPKKIKTITPGFWRRIICMIYEFLLLIAVLFIAGFIFHFVYHDTESPYFRPIFQCYLLSIAGIYLIWFWTHGGQTLAMQTWRMKIISSNGDSVSKWQAIVRYFLAVASIPIFGCGLFWALFDREGQFLYDRLAGTKIITTT